MRFFSPAKINLFLRVLGKRADGYHALYTHMQTVSLFDEITIKFGEHQDVLMISDSTLPSDASNLILKATTLFRKKTNLNVFFVIDCLKKIPHGAGLGGGSSNASTTLFACSYLTGLHVEGCELQKWSEELGSDCPFFFSTGSAICSGRGEVVHDVPLAFQDDFYIYKPTESLSTKEVFGVYQPPETIKTISLNHLYPSELSLNPKTNSLAHFDINTLFMNDLEPCAMTLCPVLKSFKSELKNQFREVVMSGSGTAFICRGPIAKTTTIALRLITRDQNQWYQPLYTQVS